jgi:hypothetical protein
VVADLHQSDEEQDPGPAPHQSEKSDPDHIKVMRNRNLLFENA